MADEWPTGHSSDERREQGERVEREAILHRAALSMDSLPSRRFAAFAGNDIYGNVSSFGPAPISLASFSNSPLARRLERWWRSAKIISFFWVCSKPVNSVTRTL